MDSVSLQSSSGGDAENDSRAARPFSFNTPHLRPTPPLLNYIQLQNPTSTAARKKRPRASRRAPTTVLTTDTINFRAMVEEFTGIPAPPFNSRPRLHLFGPRSTRLDPHPPNHLRRSSAIPTVPINYQLLPTPQSTNLFNAQNPNPMFLFPNSEAIPITTGEFNDFGSTTTLHYLPNLVPPDQINGGKGPENGGEGMVESWICSSY